LVDGFIQHHAALVQHQHGIDEAVEVAYLVRRDDDAAVVAERPRHELAKLHFTRNIEAVGRLVEHQQAGVGGQGKGYHHLL
nr:hypothetical protein [Tanacetum cinerariifolium]